MKRVLIFSVAYAPFIGGAEIAVREITHRLGDTVSFDMITLNLDTNQSAQEQVGNVTVHRIGSGRRIHKLLYPFAAYYLATKLHTMRRYDATWSIMASFSGFAALFFKLRFPRIPFILTLQEGDPISYIKRQALFVYPLFKMIFRQADMVHVISQYLAQFARYMGATAPIVVVPNGVDIPVFTRTIPEDEKHKLREKFNITEQDKVIITTSRLVLKNAVDVLIQSLTHLSSEYKVLVVGVGELREELEQLAREKNVEKRVIFAGQAAYSTIPEYLSIAHVFVRPSRSEGMGNSFIEAMAAGVPVIGTNVGGIPDFLKNGKTGLVCELDNPEDLAEKISLMMYDAELRANILENGKRLAKEAYDWEYIAAGMKTQVFDPALS